MSTPSLHRRPRPSVLVAAAATLAAVTAGVLAPTTAWAKGPGGPGGPGAGRPDSISVNVKFARGVDPTVVAARLGLTIDRPLIASRRLFHAKVALLDKEINERDPAPKVVARLRSDAGVQSAEADDAEGDEEETRFFAWTDDAGTFVGGEPSIYQQQPALTTIGLADAQKRTKGAGIVVAILDSGIDASHPALAGRVIGGYDYVNDTPTLSDAGNGVDDDRDGKVDEAVGHGTFVAGVVSLVAPDAKLWVGRVLDSDGRGTAPVVAEAIHDAVAAGASVINMSFGVGAKVDTPSFAAAIKEATDAGVVLVAAAGNGSSKSQFFPAASSGVLSVSASRTDGRVLSRFSNYGKWVDVAAPGEQIVSTTPGGYSTWSGTSVASPFVAGQAALLRSLNRNERADKIIELIRTSAKKLDKPDEAMCASGVINVAGSVSKIR